MKNATLKLTTFILILISFISCSKDKEIIQDEIVNVKVNESVELKIDGKTYKSINNELGLSLLLTFYQGNTGLVIKNGDVTEGNYFITYKIAEDGMLIDFELEEIKYVLGEKIVKHFKTPTYKPLNSFQIHKFEVNKATKKINIEFSGLLNSTSGSSEHRQIEGKVFHSYSIAPPYGRDYCFMKSNDNLGNFNSSDVQVVNNGLGHQTINYVSGDGRNISIKLNQPLKNFTKIVFDENSEINKVIYREAQPPFIINDSDLESIHLKQKWQEYHTSGNLVVTDVYNGSKPGGGLQVKGVIDLTIRDKNNIKKMKLNFVTTN